MKRRLSEIHARAQAVADDKSGVHARQWLEGVGPSTPRNITAKYGRLDLFDTYSASEHADARGMHWWLMVPTEGTQRGVLVQPHRRPPFGNAILTRGDTAPAQRFGYLGGAGTLSTVEPLLSIGGDEMLFLESRYVHPPG